MAGNENTPDERTREVEELRARLNEAEETLRAIRSGEVDTLVVSGPRGDQVFTLQGADLPYRVFLEEMSEGALTLSNEGLVLFCNRRFAELVKMPLGLVIGSTFASLLTPGQAEPFAALLREGLSRRVEGEITARAADGTLVPLRLAIDPSRADGSDRVCVVARDLTETKAMAASMRRVREGLEQAVVERTAALNSTIRELDASRVAALNLMEDAVAARDQTERASLALRESESQFRSLVEGAPNAIFVQVELRFSYVNSAACRLFGADSPEQLQGQPVMDRFHPSVWETARRRIRTPNEEMESVPLIPETWIRLDGSEVPVDVTAVPITYQGKDGVLVFAHDITVRRLGDEQQALAMRVLAALNRGDDFTELIRDILLLVKEHTGMEAVGIRLREGDDFPYCETNGFPGSFVDAERHLCARDAAGEIVRDADGNPVLECMCGTVIRGRTNPSKPFFTRGGSFWTNGTTQLLASTTETDRQGPTRNRCNGQGYESVALVPLRSDAEVIGLLQLNDRRKDMFTSNTIAFFEGLGASIGIALSRRRAIAAVRESEVRAQSLFEASPDAVFVVGAHGQFLEVNSVAVSRYGYSREELLAMSPSDLAVPNLRDEVPGRVAPARELVTRFDWEHRRKDGSAFPVEIITSPFVLGGQPSVLAVVRDVTERKKAHAERDKLQEQLRISQKMDAIGSLAGGVAHDFNNLLSVILGYTDLALADFPEGDPIRGNLLEIKKSGERAAALTRQLLAFSRKQ
ncbi:MAG: hypothetical protein QG597_705, partial [Actinomycetota bacterium]|nr:hypothetical protein [Actinomycetota bacterium]